MKGSILTSILIAGSLFFGGIATSVHNFFNPTAPVTQSVGAVNYAPSGGGTYRIASSISSTQTTITLTSFAEPVSGTKYTMAVLNSDIAYGTIAPQTNYTEFISFTGITQNANGTATLTGVVRGLGRSYPYAETSALKQPHSAQSIFILSNSPSLYNEYVSKRNDETITGIKTHTVSPIVPTPTLATQAANKSYVDSVSYNGTTDADTVTKGISQIANDTDYATTGSTGARLVIGADSASTTSTANKLARMNASGKLNQNMLDLTSQWAFSGGVLNTASSTNTATTTISASSVTGNALKLNGVPYSFPLSGIASSTTWGFDANGKATYWDLNKQIVLLASDNLKQSADTERTGTGGYTLKKSIRVYHTGVVRVKYDHKSTTSTSDQGTSAIYKNGTLFGAETSNGINSAYTTVSEDIAVQEGDYIQLYIKFTIGSGTSYCKNFRLYYDQNLVTDNTVVTD